MTKSTKIHKAKKIRIKSGGRKKPGKITKQGWVAILVAFILVMSGIGFMLGGDTSSATYNGIKFMQSGNYEWVFKISGQKHSALYHPEEVDHINISAADFLMERKQFYVSTETTEDYQKNQVLDFAKYHLSYELMKHKIIIGNGVTKEIENYEIPVITCENATEYVPVIELRYGNESIEKKENCLVITTHNEVGMMMVEHAILYKILGVIR